MSAMMQRLKHGWLWGLCLVGGAAAAVPASPEPPAGAQVAVAYAGADGQIRGFNYDRYFHPASTQKLLTAAAAMLFLGPDYRTETSLSLPAAAVRDGRAQPDARGVLHADAVLRFGGDPAFTDAQLRALWRPLCDAGVRELDGTVWVDRSRFGGRSRAKGWSWDDIPACFTAPADAAVINGNCTFAQLHAAAPGAPVRPEPSSSLVKISATAVGVSPGAYGGDCELEVDLYAGNEYRVSGCVPVNRDRKPFPLSLAVADPEAWALGWTRRVLDALPLRVRAVKTAAAAVPSDGWQKVASVPSAPLTEIVRHMLLRSDNLYADAVAKNLAYAYYRRPATYARAASAVRAVLRRQAGLDLAGAHLVDGSGLSPHNLLTAGQLLRLLQYLDAHEAELHLLSLLPVAGKSGTLRWRASVSEPPLRGQVIAKTGALTNVTNLAGVVTAKSGRRVPFVILANGLTFPPTERERIGNRRQVSPQQRYERYVLERLYAGLEVPTR